MNLYYAPMACSLAARIAFYEAGVAVNYVEVDFKSRRLPDGSSYWDIAPLGQVPALQTDDGPLITENAAILQHIVNLYPEAQLAPRGSDQRTRLQQWLSFIGAELHKAIFQPLLDSKASAEVKAYVSRKIELRFGYLQSHLERREYLLDEFSVADAYLLAVLNWTAVANIDLTQWPAVAAYRERLLARPNVAKAEREEYELYRKEQALQAAS